MEVSIEDIEEGLILTQPIINNYGQMLLPAGAKLSLKHINLLKTWNIECINVRGEGDSDTGETVEFGDDVLKHAKSRLNSRLNWIPENELEQELYDIGLKRACEIIGRAQNQ